MQKSWLSPIVCGSEKNINNVVTKVLGLRRFCPHKLNIVDKKYDLYKNLVY